MAEKTILLKVLEFTPRELECLLKTAIKLLYIDGIAEIPEWNIIALVPALLEIEQENAPEELKEQWKEKITAAARVIESQDPDLAVSELKIRQIITERDKQETFLVLLLMIVYADNKLDKLEFQFIINNITAPWNFDKEDILDILHRNQDAIGSTEGIIRMLEQHYQF